jgi:hypothetical protein
MPDNSKKLCFVIGPIGNEGSEPRIHADWLYEGIIAPVLEQHFPDLHLDRADKIAAPGRVDGQIINRLYEADLVIADLSFHNPNAFYELAIRHNVGKPMIHMIRKGEQIPFDVIGHRAIHFSTLRISDVKEAQAALRPAVAAALADGFKADNPIMHARGELQLQQNASPEIRVITDEIESIKSQIMNLQIASDVQSVSAFGTNVVLSPVDRAALTRRLQLPMWSDRWPPDNSLQQNIPSPPPDDKER